MITKEKVNIYTKYKGDIDLWARSIKIRQQEITDKEWYLIDEIISDLQIIRSGFASEEFKRKLAEKLLIFEPEAIFLLEKFCKKNC